MSPQDQTQDLSMDVNSLYREETFTDRRIGTIRRMTPVTKDGATDDKRDVLYVGETQLMTPMGTLPLTFQIEARSLEQAVQNYGQAAEQAVEQAKNELREMQRDQASRIVTPEQGGGGGMPGGGGGMPGGGFQMP